MISIKCRYKYVLRRRYGAIIDLKRSSKNDIISTSSLYSTFAAAFVKIKPHILLPCLCHPVYNTPEVLIISAGQTSVVALNTSASSSSCLMFGCVQDSALGHVRVLDVLHRYTFRHRSQSVIQSLDFCESVRYL